MNMFNAARAAGYSDSVARQACVKIEPQVGIADLFDQVGATDKALAQKLFKIAFTAKKIQNVNIILKHGEDGKLEAQDTDDFIEIDDCNAQLQAIRQITDLKRTGKVAGESGSAASVETFFIELLKKRSKELDSGEGIRITHVASPELDEFIQR
jgi:hypothetical protein